MSYHVDHDVTVAKDTFLKPGITAESMRDDHDLWCHESELFHVEPSGEFFAIDHKGHHVAGKKVGFSGDDHLQDHDLADFLKKNLVSGSVIIECTGETFTCLVEHKSNVFATDLFDKRYWKRK